LFKKPSIDQGEFENKMQKLLTFSAVTNLPLLDRAVWRKYRADLSEKRERNGAKTESEMERKQKANWSENRAKRKREKLRTANECINE